MVTKQTSTFNQLVHFWPIVAAVLAVAAAVGATGVKVQRAEKEVEEVQSVAADQAQRIARLEEAVKQLPIISADIKELLKRVR